MKVSLSLEFLDDLKKTFEKDYNPESCLKMLEFETLKKQGNMSYRIHAKHCVEFENLVRSPYCKNCQNKLPYILALNNIIKSCQKDETEVYNLDTSTENFNLLKSYLPEKGKVGEVDSILYSIVPKERLAMEPLNLNALAKFCKDIFEDEKFVSWSAWVVESGKHEDAPNPHIHAVVKFRNSHNFADRLKRRWKKIFPLEENAIDWKRYDKKKKKMILGTHTKRCFSKAITEEKIRYLDNSKKGEFGEDHTNYIDLGIKGGLSS